MRLLIVCLLLLGVLNQYAAGFYLPGVKMQEYAPTDIVDIKVNKLTSKHTQLPYKYYTLAFCKPKTETFKVENLGEILRGDKIENSLYEVVANPSVPVACKAINALPTIVKNCTHYEKADLVKFSDFISKEYRVQWIMDNLPAAVVHGVTTDNKGKTSKKYDIGFPLGTKLSQGEIFINNHVDINVVYSKSPVHTDNIVILGFEVNPMSYNYDIQDWNQMSDADKRTRCPKMLSEEQSVNPSTPQDIIWTYSVNWEEDNSITWTSRWDVYLQNTDAQIHWFSIINSLMIVLFLTGMVAMIMMRTLRADFRRYNQMEPSDEEGETGWKLVHGDVFRPPSHPMALSVLIGSGVQIIGMTVITMVFAVLGFLSPAQRGMLVTAFVVLFVIMGVFAGYFSTRSYKSFKGVHWKKNTIMTAFSFPGVVFVIFFFLNMIERGAKSSGAVPVSTLFSLIALWFGISVPLVFFGSYFGYKKPLPEDPVRTNQIPRQIPEQVWYMSPLLSVLMGGILPFGAVFIELFFIFKALWDNTQLYYIFGFLFIVFIILVITCAEITVVMCYFQLCSEDYHWWWRAFLTSGASAFYMFLYSVFYFFTKSQIEQFVSSLLYFGYTLIMTIAFFVLTGTIGFYACYFFVRKIYSSIHVD